MLLKKIITGALTVIMITGMCVSETMAKDNSKTTDYQAYSAELDKTTYDGSDLGATYSKKATVFKVWSPKATSVKVNLYEYGSDSEGDSGSLQTTNMKLDKKTGVWSAEISGDILGKYYTYTVAHDKSVKETADIYAKACGVNGKRSMVVDLKATNPDGWENDPHILVQNQTQASVWEVSVADFSSSKSSGVSEANRGKYLAFTEQGTTVNAIEGGASTCIDYLKRLGVKYVQIMPFYDFGSVDESKDINSQYNWGYDPVNYNCPEGSFSSNPYKGDVRIKECKQMIKALHDAGIGVIMDVVYNHTYSSDSAFQATVPNYYYRMNSDGTFSNGSGCGNDTASEHKMFRKYMIESVAYWVKEYHIDGFRFDLMGLHDVDTMNEIRKTLDNLYEDGSGKKLIMYGEAWDMPTACDEGTVMANQKNLKKLSDRIGAFDDMIRDAIKGSNAGTDKGFVQEGSNRSALKTGIAGQSDSIMGWANAPTQCVTYTSCHDNLSAYDKLVNSIYGTDKDYRKRYEDLVAMNKLAGAIVLTSQGIPFMLSGEEFARSKDGDENSYSSSREENMLDWESLNEFSDMVEYYRGLYKIRNNFSAFSDPTQNTANSINFLKGLPKGVVGYTVANTESGKWNKMCMLFNGTENSQTVSVDGEWIKLADEETAGLRNLGEVNGSVSVAAHSAVILVDKAGYISTGVFDDEGAVVVNYYDKESKELLGKQTVTGQLNSAYDVTSFADTIKYDIIEVNGEKKGLFTDSVQKVDIYVKEYEGKMATVVFKFVDEETNKDISESFLLNNREGQQYFTPEVPSVDGYSLNLEALPDNGAGELKGDTEVVYKYTRNPKDSDESVCKVNAIYMDDTGKIIEYKTLTGKEGEAYIISENEYEDKKLIEVPQKISGAFAKGEINVVLNYISIADPYKKMLGYVYIGTGVIVLLCIASTIHSSIKRKRNFIKNMDIDE